MLSWIGLPRKSWHPGFGRLNYTVKTTSLHTSYCSSASTPFCCSVNCLQRLVAVRYSCSLWFVCDSVSVSVCVDFDLLHFYGGRKHDHANGGACACFELHTLHSCPGWQRSVSDRLVTFPTQYSPP
jgi:hypothetical protein